MKPIPFLLTASLAANAALAVILFSARNADSVARPVPAASGPASTAESRGPVRSTPSAGAMQPRLWDRLKCDDLGELGQRLRDAGFTGKEVRAMLAATIFDREQAQRDALAGKAENTPYWRNESYLSNDPKMRAEQLKIANENRRLYSKYVLTAEALTEDEDLRVAVKRRYGDLSLEKLQQIEAIQQKFGPERMRIFGDASTQRTGEPNAAQVQALGQMEREQRAALAAVLTPAELLQYDRRTSPRSSVLRQSLALFNPTEAEFKALFELARPVDQQFSNRYDRTQSEARAAAEKQLIAQAESVLGAERYADYEVAMTHGNDKVVRLMARLDLPLSTIKTIDHLRADLTARAAGVRGDSQLNAAERSAQLAALAEEARIHLTTQLGDRGFAAYRELQGDWVDALAPASP